MRLAVLLLVLALAACGAPVTTASPVPAGTGTPMATDAPVAAPAPASTGPDAPEPVSVCVPAPARQLNVRLLRQVAYDYDPLNSPEELVAEVPLVVAGTVEDFLPGRVAEEGIPGDRTHYVLMPVRVSDRFKGQAGDVVHVQFFQGGIWRNETPVHSVADFRRAIPAGTRVLVFVHPHSPQGAVIKDRAGLPAGTPVYSAHPQGVLLGRGLDVIGGMEEIDPRSRWADPCGLDGIAARLRAAGFTG
ncbi:hypothetical protein [Planomonospora venezuelensis]|uniref:Lipoprotein n=1 Tax=Planomonospora venezuelensis TaxID=1999 RepID=A0A841D2D3_PLAVE|nr:hypothetical protein [Planomonospora venezuelensis]MBB5963143.1 hypothetical protein [Planomonospora venezuelensis]